MKAIYLILSLLPILSISPIMGGEEARLLRFPTIHENNIVFSYAGDLYMVNAQGGVARKLTNHKGYEMFPHFSPDGRQIAFTGQYDGNTEVYLMDIEGGAPRRLTVTATLDRDDVGDRMGPNNIVLGWKHSGDEVLFRSRMHSFDDFKGALYTISTKGGLAKQLPVPRGGFCSYSPDDDKIAYNRVFREFRTWKRYRGGMADDVWILDFATKQLKNITDHPAQDIIPMWKGKQVYFLSDRTKRMNLYVHNTENSQTRQLTDFKDYDIKFPTLGPKAIVFEYGGFIYRFDLATEKAEKVKITIDGDFLSGRGGLVSVKKSISNFEIAPDGKRALFGARGDVFTVPAKHGRTRNLTRTSGIHERSSKWSPNGKWVAYFSDRSGEDEVHIVPQDGSGSEQQITTGGDVYKYLLKWSPDSKKIMWADRKHRLFFVTLADKKITQVAHSKAFSIRSYSWSPDSSWITYENPEVDGNNRVYLYSLDSGESFPATSGVYYATRPAFSDDGKFLLVLRARDFRPIYSWTEWNHAYVDMMKIDMIALNKEVHSPFEPESDEVKVTEEKEEEAEGRKKGKKKGKKEKGQKDKDGKAKGDKPEKVVVKVDPDGLFERVISLPVKGSNYFNLTWANDAVYYMRNGRNDQGAILLRYDFKKKKETELGKVRGYEISHDNKKMLVGLNGGKYAIIDTPANKIKAKEFLDLSEMEVRLDRHEEWAQIFRESWRQMRDFFYAPNMHGVDWQAEFDRYAPLLENVNHRNDLTYIIGEMIGELNVGHAYVGGGDRPKPKRIKTGLLGAQLSRDASGYYKIDKILEGESGNKALRSPLRAVGVNVSEGDFILAVDGRSTKDTTNIYMELTNTVGKPVVLTVNGQPTQENARKVTVKPIGDESELYYHDWVQDNIRKVTEATEGKVGYLHIPDMDVKGLNEFVKYYYPQLRKKALIIDVRGNGGGNVSPMIIERLRRELAMVDMGRNESTRTDPGGMFLGPMVCLLDEFSASDGDIFPYRFKHHKLGKLIGKRSWGGVVGIRGSLPFVDGGTLMRPEGTGFSPDGTGWIIEGYGVDPDIVVDNHPMLEFGGLDEQLTKGIEVILEELKTKGRELPPIPDYPIKN